MRRYSNHLGIYETSTCQPKILSTTIFSKSCSNLPFNMCFYVQSFSPSFWFAFVFFVFGVCSFLWCWSPTVIFAVNSTWKCQIWNWKCEKVNINPLTSSVFFFVFYIYSKLTSKSIINPLSACLLLKQCWTRLAAMTHLVRCTHVHPTGYQNPQQLCENELKSVKNSLFSFTRSTSWVVSFLSNYTIENLLI